MLETISGDLDTLRILHERIECMPGMVFEFDLSGKLTYVNRQGLDSLGYSFEQILKMNAIEFIVPNEQERAFRGMRYVLKGKGYRSVPYTFIRSDGSTFPVHVYISKIEKDNRVIGARGLAVDITEVTQAESKLNEFKEQHNALIKQTVYNTLYDPLTGLLNRETFIARTQVAIMRFTKRKTIDGLFAVMCLSIDRFKQINDMYGKNTGDSLIRQAAVILKSLLRPDDILCRYDGNQFMALLLDIDRKDSLTIIINKVMDIFGKSISVDEKTISLKLSIGLSTYPDDAANEEELIQHAEDAMYIARKKRKNSCQLYDEAMHNRLLDHLHMEEELRKAVACDEFLAFFQGKHDRAGNLSGMETLIRWLSPTRGFVSPLEFISIAESNGMIIDIGNLILHKACRHNRNWILKGLRPLPFSVNLSPYQFQHPDLIKDIEFILRDTSIEPGLLELEITESGIMLNEIEALEKLAELHRKGFSISIDDFGTGYSSLSKLQSYPIDTLKIDRSFIDPIPDNEKSNTITTAIIDLGHNLGFKVVAEGVENTEQFKFLQIRGCDQYQGYLFSRPLPDYDFEKLISQ